MTNNTVRHNTIMQYLYVIARYVFPLITLPYLTRVLGPDCFGVRAYIIAFMLFIQTVSDFGFNLSGAREIVKNEGSKTADSRIMGNILFAKLLILGLLAIVSIVFCLLSPLISSQLPCVIIAFLGVALNTLVPDFLFMGKEEMGIITTRFVISKAFATVLIFAVVRSSDDLLLCFTVDAAGSLVAFALSWAQSIKRYRITPSIPRFFEVRNAIASASPFFISNASVAAMNASATVFVGLFSGNAEEVAYWSLSITALNAVLSLYNPIANALYPHMVHSRDFAMFTRCMLAGSIAALIGAGLFVVLADPIMFVLGGNQYVDASYILAWLSPTLLIAYPALLLGNPLLGALGYERALGRSSLTAVLVYIALLVAIYICGYFSLFSVALCRVGAELLLLAVRFVIAKMNLGSFLVIRRTRGGAAKNDDAQET